MPISEHLTSYRYRNAVEGYRRHGSQVADLVRPGRYGAIAAVTVRAAAHAAGLAATQPPPDSPRVEPRMATKALAALGSGIETVIGWEQRLTAATLGYIPFPKLPALRVGAMAFGIPHAHNHPPNLTPPNPVPVPLSSFGVVVPIPILSGAMHTQIAGRPAARCGDLGLAAWCGGFFPFFELFLGSATVWCESARASRLGFDITSHCIFAAPKPTDPPVGPMAGFTITGSAFNVLIGGVPTPSLLSLAITGVIKAARGGRALYNRCTAKQCVQDMLGKDIFLNRSLIHHTDVLDSWGDDVVADLEAIASTRAGRDLLNQIRDSSQIVMIGPYTEAGLQASASAPGKSFVLADGTLGNPCSSRVKHDPNRWSNNFGVLKGDPSPGTTSDAVLFHELVHANNVMRGQSKGFLRREFHDWDKRWTSFEEYSTIAADNGYRSERGLPLRKGHNHLP